MAEVSRHEPGAFSWAELGTSDAAGAKRFYTSLFGWSYEDSPAGPDMIYTRLKKGGRDVGALYQLGKEQAAPGIPPNWMSYVTVASADETAKRAGELGGKVLMGAFDVMEYGRMAVLQDPTGATFSVWEPRSHIGAQVINEPGALCWNELNTDDPDTAARFYTGLFGWKTKVTPEYSEFHRGATAAGGMMKIPESWGNVPPNWLVYFAVEDPDAIATRAGELGGEVIVAPTDIPDVGRFAVLRDPQGAVFAIVKLTGPPA